MVCDTIRSHAQSLRLKDLNLRTKKDSWMIYARLLLLRFLWWLHLFIMDTNKIQELSRCLFQGRMYVILETNIQDANPQVQILNRHQKWEKFYFAEMSNLRQPFVPTGPPPEFKPLDDIPSEAVREITAIFEQRPVWTRVAILNSLTKDYIRYIKQLLPRVAYVMSRGPFKDGWIKYGYDPRNHPESAPLQLVTLRYAFRT